GWVLLMVVVHQLAVPQVAAVVDAATGAHGGLLQDAQPGRRLAGVPDAGAATGSDHEAPRRRRHAREVAEEIERGALAGEHRRQRPAHPSEHLLGADLVAVAGVPG